MDIRKAVLGDLGLIQDIYAYARAFQAQTGNPHQWGDDGYPPQEMLREDIALGRLYVCEQDKKPGGVFMFEVGADPTYAIIEDGAWLNSEPYGVVHRIAGNGTIRAMAAQCFDFCLGQCSNLRIDTHEDNTVMQHVLQKYGFTKCGIIYLENGDPRWAYHIVKEGSSQE
ncbi:MAG: GNAT family protein [Eubacteriales bacterium]|nr:GNAT family protein [Eubacteriales bacterium]